MAGARELEDLGLESLDLYLVHFPVSFVHGIKEPTSARVAEIVDADVEFNGVDFAIAVDGQGRGRWLEVQQHAAAEGIEVPAAHLAPEHPQLAAALGVL